MDKWERINLTVNQKLEVIQKLETGESVSRICEQYAIKKQIVLDIYEKQRQNFKFCINM